MCEQQFLLRRALSLHPRFLCKLPTRVSMAGYVYYGALSSVLLFLLSPGFGAEVQNLKNITDHLQNFYGIYGQYSLGINVPARYCAKGANLQGFLSEDNGDTVKKVINSTNCTYLGNELVGATPRQIKKNINIHSESLLLRIPITNPPMKNLLNKTKDGCTVFYTFNSPCVQTCSTPNGTYSILPALDMFNSHQGPKAFVFSKVWEFDVNNTRLEENLLEIEKKIPVYRCNNTGCVRCTQDNKVVSECKHN